MQLRVGVIEAIGNTPLIKLERVSAATGCTILGKAEFMNPGQSVKDRAALFIIKDAIKRGELRPGGIIVEGTAGNTGIGLALVGNAMGFRSVIVIPETQSQEKKDTLRLCGAELIEVPAVPYSNPNNYVKLSGRVAAQLAKTEKNGAVWANQFDNVANRQGHIETTGPEIWNQTDGKVDGFVCAVGSGGTLAGVAMALKARNSAVRIALADPMGAALYSYYTTGVLKWPGPHHQEFGRRADRYSLSDSGLRSGADCLRFAGARRAVRGRLVRHQYRWRGSACQGTGTRPHHRDHSCRLRYPLSIKAIQSAVFARKKPSSA
jgi:cysteine synthase A